MNRFPFLFLWFAASIWAQAPSGPCYQDSNHPKAPLATSSGLYYCQPLSPGATTGTWQSAGGSGTVPAVPNGNAVIGSGTGIQDAGQALGSAAYKATSFFDLSGAAAAAQAAAQAASDPVGSAAAITVSTLGALAANNGVASGTQTGVNQHYSGTGIFDGGVTGNAGGVLLGKWCDSGGTNCGSLSFGATPTYPYTINLPTPAASGDVLVIVYADNNGHVNTPAIVTPTITSGGSWSGNPTITAPILSTPTITNSSFDESRINDTGTGTFTSRLVTLTASGAQVTGTTNQVSIEGVCAGGCGTSGSSTVAIFGQIAILFDSAPTAIGDYVESSSATAGYVVDKGSTDPHDGNRIVGRVASLTLQGGGGYLVNITPNLFSLPVTATLSTAGQSKTPLQVMGLNLGGSAINGTGTNSGVSFFGMGQGAVTTSSATNINRRIPMGQAGKYIQFGIQLTVANPNTTGTTVCTLNNLTASGTNPTTYGSSTATALTLTIPVSAAVGLYTSNVGSVTFGQYDQPELTCVTGTGGTSNLTPGAVFLAYTNN